MKDWVEFSNEWANATIGQRIAALMAFRGLSSHTLAPLVGVSHAAICKYRKMDDFPSSKVLLRISKALGVKVSVLLGETRYDRLKAKEITKARKLEPWENEWMNAPMGTEVVE